MASAQTQLGHLEHCSGPDDLNMKRIALLSLIFAGSLMGQQTQHAFLAPWGIWSACKINSSLAASIWCTSLPDYAEGKEPLILEMNTDQVATTAFSYDITATNEAGVEVRYKGAVLRASGPYDTVCLLYVGMLHGITIKIVEQTATKEWTREQK